MTTCTTPVVGDGAIQTLTSYGSFILCPRYAWGVLISLSLPHLPLPALLRLARRGFARPIHQAEDLLSVQVSDARTRWREHLSKAQLEAAQASQSGSEKVEERERKEGGGGSTV